MFLPKINISSQTKSEASSNSNTFFQPKYNINKPNDVYEQEADSVAEKVVQSKDINSREPFFKPAVQIQNKIQRQEAEPESKEDLKESYTLPDFFDRRLDWFEMSRPFSSRGAESYLYLDDKLHHSVGNVWTKNYKFFFDFGFGDDVSADAANFFTPFTIDSALKRDFPTQSEMFERNADISSIVVSPTVFTFDITDIPGTLRMPFFSIFGADKSNPYSGKKKIQRKCKECEEEETLQKKNLNNDEVDADSNFESYVDNLNSGGERLSDEARKFFEPKFGYDFSNVKIHKDSVATKSAQSINALAYTSGNNIVFNQNQYSPETDTGKKLLGHELTHVIQQGSGAPGVSVQKTESGDNKGGGWNSDIDSLLVNSANYYLKVQLGIKDDYAYSKGGCEDRKDNNKFCKVNTKKGFVVNIFWQPDYNEMTISSSSCIGGGNYVCRYSYSVAENGQLVHKLIHCDLLACI
ncbi:MAG: DUF4157 domain-containing protein [Ignavibacteria bacterium]|nr:DUF4157 domain-containing protein [Ignavibacteria bacterium]